jgi:hypothetical protein
VQEQRLSLFHSFRSVKFEWSDLDGMRSVRRRYNVRSLPFFPSLAPFLSCFFSPCLSLPVEWQASGFPPCLRLAELPPASLLPRNPTYPHPQPSVAILGSVARAERLRLVKVAGSPRSCVGRCARPILGGGTLGWRSGALWLSKIRGIRTHALHLQFFAILASVPRLVEVAGSPRSCVDRCARWWHPCASAGWRAASLSLLPNSADPHPHPARSSP